MHIYSVIYLRLQIDGRVRNAGLSFECRQQSIGEFFGSKININHINYAFIYYLW